MNKTALLRPLLDAIGRHEAPKGYGQIYGGAKGVPKGTDVSTMTLDAVLALQKRMLDAGSASTACGRYQFLRKTLAATIKQMGLAGAAVWTPALQDRMALHLMEGRGLSKFLSGQMSAEAFANSLAKEWASLPVVTDIMGAKRRLKPGESFYAGDGLNKALASPAVILALLDAIRKAHARRWPEDDTAYEAQPQPDDPGLASDAVPAPPPRPRGLLRALIDLILSIFTRRKS